MWSIYLNRQRAKNVITVFYVLTGVASAHIVFLAWQSYIVATFTYNDYTERVEFLTAVWAITIFFNWAGLAAYIVTAILFISWMRRAYYNLNIVNPAAASYTDNWAAGAWFVPILSFVRPYQIMREIWTGTQDAIPHRLPDRKPATLVGIWWAAFLAWNLSGYGFFFISRNLSPLRELLERNQVRIIQELLTVIAAVIALQMVKKAASFEKALWEEALNPLESVFALTSAQLPPVPPDS